MPTSYNGRQKVGGAEFIASRRGRGVLLGKPNDLYSCVSSNDALVQLFTEIHVPLEETTNFLSN